jgi:hypothetical protein
MSISLARLSHAKENDDVKWAIKSIKQDNLGAMPVYSLEQVRSSLGAGTFVTCFTDTQITCQAVLPDLSRHESH